MILKHCLQVVDGLRAHDWQQRMFATRRLEGLVLSRGGERLQPNPTTRDPAHLPPWQQWGVEGEEGGAGGLGQDARPHWAMPGQPHRPLRPVSQFKIFRPKTRACCCWAATHTQECVPLCQVGEGFIWIRHVKNICQQKDHRHICKNFSQLICFAPPRQELGHTCHPPAPPCLLPDGSQISEWTPFNSKILTITSV